jgi:hypothetical protein
MQYKHIAKSSAYFSHYSQGNIYYEIYNPVLSVVYLVPVPVKKIPTVEYATTAKSLIPFIYDSIKDHSWKEIPLS